MLALPSQKILSNSTSTNYANNLRSLLGKISNKSNTNENDITCFIQIRSNVLTAIRYNLYTDYVPLIFQIF